ncbi:hypothetical protein ATCV1_z039L [Acanthocystis turfacea chlorella virus 1]|uniref:Uncharacterized protein z039L n=1 Tax=Chlorovirus heliozoae TaxID=322019 RepID=A7K7Z9_9PHYC|nr:hypothetical protein ATCV1_z039L [Acanthocystis turfacea chlorella virus 1]ABT16173.1 hypothetical protein ATCV1_z039L [Acanthocystis turfacea chlorella virus 1]
MSIFPLYSVASNSFTSPWTGFPLAARNSAASFSYSTKATGLTYPRRPCVMPPTPANNSSAFIKYTRYF